jgi:hypothetical protein
MTISLSEDIMNALQFEAVKVSLKQDRTGFVLTLNIHPDEIPEELMRDYVGARYAVVMARILDDESATQYENRVKRAGILCRTREFQFWLTEQGLALHKSEEDAVEALYALCGITSRTELNGNSEAKQKFDDMVKEYEQWQKEEPF